MQAINEQKAFDAAKHKCEVQLGVGLATPEYHPNAEPSYLNGLAQPASVNDMLTIRNKLQILHFTAGQVGAWHWIGVKRSESNPAVFYYANDKILKGAWYADTPGNVLSYSSVWTSDHNKPTLGNTPWYDATATYTYRNTIAYPKASRVFVDLRPEERDKYWVLNPDTEPAAAYTTTSAGTPQSRPIRWPSSARLVP